MPVVSGRIWTSLRGFGPPSADLDSTTKLSENIIFNVLVEKDNTLRSSAYQSIFFNLKYAYRQYIRTGS